MTKRLLFLVAFGLICTAGTAQEFSTRYELVRMSDAVNTKLYDEAAPVISTDGKRLYFFVHNHPDNTYGRDESQDIWFSNLDDKGVWSKAKRMGPPLNQNRYNQVFNILPDGSLFVRGGRSKNSIGFSIVSPSGVMTELQIKDFEKMCKGIFYGGTISADAKHAVLYFSEVVKSKFSDLYITNLLPDGTWSVPVKLKVSTPSDEYATFLAPDQITLYFASERPSPVHYGKEDIYKITRLDDTWTNWSAPVNAGKGINTSATDDYFSIDAHGNVFTCRMGSLLDGGNKDILILKPRDIRLMLSVTVQNEKTQLPMAATTVDLTMKDQKPQSLKTTAAGKAETRISEIDGITLSASVPGFLPKQENFKLPKANNDTTYQLVLNLTPIEKKMYLSGDVLDKKTQQPVSAKLEIAYKTNTQTRFDMISDGGKYRQEVPSLGQYMLTASAEGYLNAADSVTLTNEEGSGIKNIYLTPIEIGVSVRIKNIYFDFDKTTLKPESFIELNKVVEFLKTNAHIEIEIEGHTDSKGADEYNLNLSQGRSQSVVDYLVSQGIDGGRLQAKGFGETKPVDTNDTDEGRANNRRVEFTVLKK